MASWIEWSDRCRYIAFNDLQPSRYAWSYIKKPNERAYNIEVAFIALDSENLGELVNDCYHTDFGDNQFPYYKGNSNKNLNLKKYSEDVCTDSDEDDDISSAEWEVINISKYVPLSVLQYLNETF